MCAGVVTACWTKLRYFADSGRALHAVHAPSMRWQDELSQLSERTVILLSVLLNAMGVQPTEPA